MAVEKPQVSFEVLQIAVSQADHGQTAADGALQRDERQSLRPARQTRDAEQTPPGARLGHETPKFFILFESLKESSHHKLQLPGRHRGEETERKREKATPYPCDLSCPPSLRLFGSVSPWQFSRTIRSTRSVVEQPSIKGKLNTSPPAASTSSRPTIRSTPQSPPLTNTSGSSAATISRGVGSSKIVT